MTRCTGSRTCGVLAGGMLVGLAASGAHAADCTPPSPTAHSYGASGCDAQVNGGTFDTGTSDYAAVFHATNHGSITVTAPVTLRSAGNEASGAYADNNGAIHFNAPGSTLTMQGDHSNGVHAFGSATVTGQLDITSSGVRAHAVFADYGGVIQLVDSRIETHGEKAAGLAVATGTIELRGASAITTTGDIAPGVALTSGNSHVVVDGQDSRIAIHTTGLESTGAGAAEGSGTILLNNVDALTEGDAAFGLLAQTATTLQAQNTTVSTTGPLAVGAAAVSGGVVTLAGGRITTSGYAAYGIVARGENSRADADGVTLATSGEQADGLHVVDAAALTFRNGLVTTTGLNASGLVLLSQAGGTLQRAEIVGSTLASTRGAGIRVQDGPAAVSISGSTVTAPLWLAIDASSSPISVDVTASGSTLRGATRVGAAEGGQPHVANVTLRDASTWWVTGDANLTRLDNLDSTVAFVAPTDGVFHALTLRQYHSTNGVLALTSALGGDGSPTDRLVIDTGSATGVTQLRISNAGGKGALTNEGIRVIEVANGGSAPAGAFVLAGRAVAGPFEYSLYRGGLQQPDDGNWYLRSQQLPDPPTPPNPPNPPAPPDPPRPRYRPEVPAYIATEYAATSLFVHSLHDRLGALPFSAAPAGWLRLVGKTGESGSRSHDYAARADTVVLQGGADIARGSLFGQADRLHIGAMLGYGHVQTDGLAAGNAARAKGEVNGYGAGVYATWFAQAAADTGPYVDSWLQYVWFDNAMRGDQLPRVGYHSQAWNASLEGGWAVALGGLPWRFEPQVQVVWLQHRGVDLTEPNGTRIRGGDTSGVVTRLGARVFRTLDREDGGRLQPYATLNWWHDQASTSVGFGDTVLGQLFPRDRYELKLGLNARLARGWTSWGNVAGEWGSQGFRQYGVRLGARYVW